MREIKVRGYAVEKMVGSQWIIGTGVHTTEFTDKYAAETGKKFEHFVFGEQGWVEVYGDSIGQYTGLKDRNSVEIYEGDLVEHKDYSGGAVIFGGSQPKSRSVIEWKKYYNGYHINGLGYPFKGEDLEAVGNIYEHNHLLEAAK